ncbi:MAG: fimbrial protein [Betaproteobacteria bacterium RIFCSPLOWO2_02_FULL_67_26]|nr:MAG: fimbrial protein [Betaproteobacteria bacterium RIFCSPLOWO2_02_FULL_67_26]
MIRINLLPHREIRRKQQQQQFFIMLGVVVVIGVAIWGAVHVTLDDQLNNQMGRNQYLLDETVKLDKQIAEIQKLKDQTAALLARKRVVETLQSTRSEVVHLMDQLARQLPDGVFLKSIKQADRRVTITGYTQSQARVSTLMRNLESSPHLERPGLIEIKTASLGGQRMNEFNMSIFITRAAAQDGKK